MLLQVEIEKFFKNNDIQLRDERPITQEKVEDLTQKSLKLGYSFFAFIMYGVINVTATTKYCACHFITDCTAQAVGHFAANYNSWDHMYECYCAFMRGFLSKSMSLNN